MSHAALSRAARTLALTAVLTLLGSTASLAQIDGAGGIFGGRQRPVQPAAAPAELEKIDASGGLTAALGVKSPENFTFEDVVKLIADHKANTLEELLPQLPFGIRSRFVLMNQSRSSHQASNHFPRVILCSPTARLMMAYSTAHSDENRNMLEVIQWRDDTEKFEFREIAFEPRGRKPPKISEANPSRCNTCHGDSMRPNWEPASSWPGAIGHGLHLEEVEVNQLTALAKRNDPRLRALAWGTAKVGNESPSSQMARHVNVLNMTRMARFLRDSRDYELYKYSIVAGLLGLPEFLDVEPVMTAYLERPADYRDRLNETKKTLEKTLAQYYSPNDGESIANVRFIFETRKVSIRDVATSFRTPFLITGDRNTDFGSVVLQLYETDIELRKVAPLPASFERLRSDTPERQELAKQLVRAGAAAWERRVGKAKDKVAAR